MSDKPSPPRTFKTWQIGIMGLHPNFGGDRLLGSLQQYRGIGRQRSQLDHAGDGDICHPEVCGHLDWNFDIAIQTRRDILSRYAGTDRMVLGTHFADPTAVYIVQHGETWRVRQA